jgi:hypothetical protein
MNVLVTLSYQRRLGMPPEKEPRRKFCYSCRLNIPQAYDCPGDDEKCPFAKYSKLAGQDNPGVEGVEDSRKKGPL